MKKMLGFKTKIKKKKIIRKIKPPKNQKKTETPI